VEEFHDFPSTMWGIATASNYDSQTTEDGLVLRTLAAKKSADDIEYVHQLRVATRRASAAVQIFAELLPKRKSRLINRRLRELRQAAGEARDLDVLGERSGSPTCCGLRPVRDVLLGMLTHLPHTVPLIMDSPRV
jgi:CHAD domain-containing protein